MTRRVAITGIGLLSALGRGTATHLDAVRRSASGVRTIRRFDASAMLCRIAAEIPDDLVADLPKQFDRTTGYALLAADEAAAASRLLPMDGHRLATIIGTGLGGAETLDNAYVRLYDRKQTRLPPMSIPLIMYNAPTSAIAAKMGARGPAYAIVSACASSAHAIGQAAHWIRLGLADAALAGGSDAPLTLGIVRGWEALRVLAIDNEEPARACRPFSADRKGLVLGEGAAVFVLEEMERARARGAEVLGEIAGFGMTSDAGHLTDPSADGEARAIRMALEDGGFAPDEIGYVNAHGTATQANDVTEARALREVFGTALERIPVSSTKSMHGHTMGASGAIETALSLVALNEGWIPPTLNLERPDPECALDHVALEARRGEVDAFISSSFAFGGLNAVLAVRTRNGVTRGN